MSKYAYLFKKFVETLCLTLGREGSIIIALLRKLKQKKSRLIAAFTLNFIKTKRRRLKTKRRQRVLQRLMQEQKFPPFNFTAANIMFP